MTGLLENLTINPEVAVGGGPSTDLLSHVLAQIRLTGDRLYSCILTDKGRLELEAEAAHVCVVTAGRLHIERDGQTPAVIDAHTPTRRRDSERRRSAPGGVIIPKSFGEQH